MDEASLPLDALLWLAATCREAPWHTSLMEHLRTWSGAHMSPQSIRKARNILGRPRGALLPFLVASEHIEALSLGLAFFLETAPKGAEAIIFGHNSLYNYGYLKIDWNHRTTYQERSLPKDQQPWMWAHPRKMQDGLKQQPSQAMEAILYCESNVFSLEIAIHDPLPKGVDFLLEVVASKKRLANLGNTAIDQKTALDNGIFLTFRSYRPTWGSDLLALAEAKEIIALQHRLSDSVQTLGWIQLNTIGPSPWLLPSIRFESKAPWNDSLSIQDPTDIVVPKEIILAVGEQFGWSLPFQNIPTMTSIFKHYCI